MLVDISPLCLYHNQPMILTQQTLHPRHFREETCHWFACPVHDCNQRYDTKRGYCVIREGARPLGRRYDGYSVAYNFEGKRNW